MTATVLVRLPDSLRGALKDPLGPVFTEADELLDRVRGPLITIGDVVTYHLEAAGETPQVSVVDERTERTPVEAALASALGDPDVTVANPPATLTRELVTALVDGLGADDPIRIHVDGEEDLATLPAILAAPEGASVVYGQPGEGMVHVLVTSEVKAQVREVVERMDGDPEELFTLLEGAPS